ncbi:hypothetical protein MesoLj113b_70860 (plasmid) [Mesorhizobium sp. 113-3-3]|nr:hypothetical protein MesoLj113b_70860 [Mesorhizobium sp. 113-3-3]
MGDQAWNAPFGHGEGAVGAAFAFFIVAGGAEPAAQAMSGNRFSDDLVVWSGRRDVQKRKRIQAARGTADLGELPTPLIA